MNHQIYRTVTSEGDVILVHLVQKGTQQGAIYANSSTGEVFTIAYTDAEELVCKGEWELAADCPVPPTNASFYNTHLFGGDNADTTLN